MSIHLGSKSCKVITTAVTVAAQHMIVPVIKNTLKMMALSPFEGPTWFYTEYTKH